MSPIDTAKLENDRRILELLSQTFPNVSAASTEIINLEAILNLPKGTEHFVADLHGEHEAFDHILRNASGNIKRKVSELFGTSMREQELRDLCTLIYYPERKLEYIKAEENDLDDFYAVTLHRLIAVCQSVSSKYTRSKVRKALPKEFSYIIEELLHEAPSDPDKEAYFKRIIETIISTGQADAFVVAICHVIQHLGIDQLHVLGDIFDRGPGAHLIMDTLCGYNHFDIQWGNHDALWMGASAGNDACIANVLRLSLRYCNMATLEDGYGINLVPLATFAMETYGDDPCENFVPNIVDTERTPDKKTLQLLARMHKAISIIQFKLEAALVDRRPEWGMGSRKLLAGLKPEKGLITIDGVDYSLKDCRFPTIDKEKPYALTQEEAGLMAKLHHSFRVSDKLKKHIHCLLSHGCMYGVYNSNLLFHASMPLNADGTLKEVAVGHGRYKGRELMHQVGMTMRAAFNDDTPHDEREFAIDYFWYLWCGPDSPLFDKSKMATFERYFVEETATHKEEKGYYYLLRDNPDVIDHILDAFGVEGEHRHIINGHVPVRINKGEKPIRANGKLLVIDGGFAKAYHHTTGIAGYTLIYHSRGLQLVQHEPFTSTEEAIRNGTDILGATQIVELSAKRMRVRDTDKGDELAGQIQELTELLHAFRLGIVKERSLK
ncbi:MULTISPECIES: fructose-1,6-bisphosphatase [Muribaculum]|uniref:Fructose-1,6-bisphosphatase n=3 Tax=Muribaculum TaxID=1918540 RepID=A0AC61S5W7_9BACT|nr:MULTISPECIES: fructose-1,6-bisphosphatase [Muribaculum]THG52702.1 fructose-1,6-bisphosphatase [Muribaculum caecicola]